MNNTKKGLQHGCAIVNICLSGLLTLLLLITIVSFDAYFEIVAANVQLSTMELEMLKSSTLVILIMGFLLVLVTLIFSIVAEVFTAKQKNAKGLFITLIVMDAILTLCAFSAVYFLAFAVPLGLAIAVVCMKDKTSSTSAIIE